MYNYYEYDDDYVYDDDVSYSPSDELYHYGVRGMKWGVRRYQNADGSPTAAGRGRYGGGVRGHLKRNWKKYAAGAAGVAGAAGLGYLAYRNRGAIGSAVKRLTRDDSAGGYVMRTLRENSRPVVGRKLKKSGRVMNTIRNIGGNYAEAAGSRARSLGIKVGARSRAALSGARGGVRSALGTMRNVGGNYAEAAGRRARSLGIRAGSAIRSRAGGVGGSIRNIGGHYGSRLASKARSYGTAAGMTARSLAKNKTARRVAVGVAGAGALAGGGAYGYSRYKKSRRRGRR